MAKRTPERVAERHRELVSIWPRNTNATSIHQDELDAAMPCDCRGCPHPAAAAVVINVWGTVFEHYVCAGHQYVNNSWRDTLPSGPPVLPA